MTSAYEDLDRLSRIHDIIPISVCYALHSVFNGILFKPVPASYFVSILNLHDSKLQLEIPKLESSRFCYILDHVANRYLTLPDKFIREYKREHLTDDFDYTTYRKEWISIMLGKVGISQAHFNSHYRDAKDSTSKKNRLMSEKLKECHDIMNAIHSSVSD